MSFSGREESRTLGNPIVLALFKYGAEDSEFYAYTTAEQPVTLNTITYIPKPMDFGKIESSGTLDKKTLEVRLPITTEVADLFILPPSYPVTMILRRGHIGDPQSEFLVEWSGRVLSGSRQNSECTLSCEPISTAMRRAGLRRNYQYGCPHVLYGPQCNANKAAATSIQTVVSLTGSTITFTDGWETDLRAEKALGGLVQWTGPNGTVLRTILEVDSLTTLHLNAPTTGLQAGDTVQVSLGCNHRFELTDATSGVFVDTDCKQIHDNVPNYGGQPWIPLDNPIGTALNKYY